MFDLFKYSKKNKLFHFLINTILRINTDKLSEPIYHQGNIDLDLKKIFYEYMENFPITKWGGTNIKEHYQSNHNLQNLKN